MRSKFVITSLRPAFAKIYPSTRPDLAVETFFHARPGSPLLRGITDDDFITWFDKTELASLKTSASIDNICECGRICSRDYEFRKNYEERSEETTTNIEVTTVDTTTVEMTTTTTDSTTVTSTEMSTTAESTITELSSTSISTTEATTIQDSAIITDKETSPETTSTANTAKTDNIDDPIIIPTVIYVNKTDSLEVSNNIAPLVPKINGELIVQKSVLPKIVPKKDEIKKKPLPRRKGTLKATYGDKHEKFFMKVKEIYSATPTSTEKNVILNETIHAPIFAAETAKSLHKVVLEKPDIGHVLLQSAIINSETHTAATSTEINAFKTSTIMTTTAKETNDIITRNKTSKQPNVYHDNISVVKTIKTPKSPHTEVIPHTITAITNNNIKNIHYRTKKPKAITQIKKPLINAIHNNATKYNKSEVIDSDINNKTKKKPQKYNAKSLKSINKEIHKIPSTPISETSKTMSETVKSDIAPENKGGFEILDKNNLWELLKEGSDNDPSKMGEKLHVHNRLNILGHNMSNVDDNRSL